VLAEAVGAVGALGGGTDGWNGNRSGSLDAVSVYVAIEVRTAGRS
jgi:hypothetical protein